MVQGIPDDRTAASDAVHIATMALVGFPPTTDREVRRTTCSTPARLRRSATVHAGEPAILGQCHDAWRGCCVVGADEDRSGEPKSTRCPARAQRTPSACPILPVPMMPIFIAVAPYRSRDTRGSP